MTYWRELKNPQLEMLVDAWHPVHIEDGKSYAPWWATDAALSWCRMALVFASLVSLMAAIVGGGLSYLGLSLLWAVLAWHCEESE